MEVIARAGISAQERVCDQVRPPSWLRKMPPRVVPANISRGRARVISMAEIGDPSNEPDTGLQRWPLLSVRHRRFDPAQRVLTPWCVEGSMARTVNARWPLSRAEICRGLTCFQCA